MTVRAVLSYRAKQDGTCTIRIYVYHNGKKTYVPTKLSVLRKDWNKRKGEVKKSHPLSNLYNSQLTKKIRAIEEALLSGKEIHSIRSKAESIGFLAYMERYIQQEKLLSEATMRIYRTTFNHLKNYLISISKTEATFDEITPLFINGFRDYLYETGCMEAGQRHVIKKIKKLMRLSKQQGLHHATDWEKIAVPKERVTNKIYLTKEEIQRLYDLDLSYNTALEKERDRFWLAYKFMMRFSDITKVRREMCVEMNGKSFLVYTSAKTKIKATVPLSKHTIELLEKYDWQLNFTSNQQANREIKRIIGMAGINQVVEQEGKTAPKSQFVTFHTARRSAATNAYLSGLSLKIIADVGGWKKLATLQVYLRASQLVSANQAADHQFFKE